MNDRSGHTELPKTLKCVSLILALALPLPFSGTDTFPSSSSSRVSIMGD